MASPTVISGWEAYLTRAKPVLDLLFAFLGAVGVWRAARELSINRVTRRLGEICLDEEKMGYFVAVLPSRWRQLLFPFFFPTIENPQVPLIGAYIAMSESLGSSYRQGLALGNLKSIRLKRFSNSVTWVPLLEAWLRERAWAASRPHDWRFERARAWSWDSVKGILFRRRYFSWNGPRDFRRDFSREPARGSANCERRAEQEVRRTKNLASFFGKGYRLGVETQSSGLFKLIRNMATAVIPFDRHPHTSEIAVAPVAFDWDHHFIYNPWIRVRPLLEILASSRGDEESGGNQLHHPRICTEDPILVQSAEPLCGVSMGRRWHFGYSDIAELEPSYRRVWLDESQPALEVSKGELIALCFVLGIELRVEHYQVAGQGAFGMELNSAKSKRGTMTVLTMNYPDPRNLKGLPIGISGCATVFSRHLACGCIPFGREDIEGDIHTIFVNPSVLNLIRQGTALCCFFPQPEQDQDRRQLQYLDIMPSSGTNRYYFESLPSCYCDRPRNDERNPSERRSQLCNLFTIEQRSGEIETEFRNQGSWCEAIARIPFGGLALMSTRTVADGVSFSVGAAALTRQDRVAFEGLADFLLTRSCAGRSLGLWRFTVDVFGRRVARRVESHLDQYGYSFGIKPPPIDQAYMESVELGDGACLLDHDGSLEDIMTELGFYKTLLEVMIAHIDVGALDSGTLPVGSAFRRGERRRAAAFESCVGQIEESYNDAVTHVLGSSKPSIHQSTAEVVNSIREDLIEANAHPLSVSAEQCGILALCILRVWSQIVRIVDWEAQVPKTGERQDHGNSAVFETTKSNKATNGNRKADERVGLAEIDAGGPARNSIKYYPPLLRDLPDVVAWE